MILCVVEQNVGAKDKRLTVPRAPKRRELIHDGLPISSSASEHRNDRPRRLGGIRPQGLVDSPVVEVRLTLDPEIEHTVGGPVGFRGPISVAPARAS